MRHGRAPAVMWRRPCRAMGKSNSEAQATGYSGHTLHLSFTTYLVILQFLQLKVGYVNRDTGHSRLRAPP